MFKLYFKDIPQYKQTAHVCATRTELAKKWLDLKERFPGCELIGYSPYSIGKPQEIYDEDWFLKKGRWLIKKEKVS